MRGRRQSKSKPEGSGRLRVVLYIRVSTDQQAENRLSLEEQQFQLRQLAAREDWQVVDVVIDDGDTGSNLRRRFATLLERARISPRPFDVIVVHSLSRAFRSIADQELSIGELEKNGVRVISQTENIHDEASGPLLRKMLGVVNEMKVHDARIGTMRGMTGTARLGYSTGATVPYGWRSVDAETIGSKIKKKWEIDPVEAANVQTMFKLALVGDGSSGPMGVKAIADHVNALGIRSRAGSLFGTGTVHEILTREAYTGERLWNVMDKNGRENPDDKIIAIPVPQIIPKPDYDRVQELLQSRQPAVRAPRLSGSPSLFGGMIQCVHCNGAMTAGTGTSRTGVQYNYYECQNKRKKGEMACQGMRISRPVAEEKVMDALLAELVTTERVCGMLSALRDRRLRAQTSEHARIAALQREAIEAQSALDQLYNLVEKQVVSAEEPTLKERLSKLVEKRDLAVLARDRALESSTAPLDVNPAEIELLTQDLREKLTTGEVSARKAWLSAVVDHIVVSEDKIQVFGRKSNFQPPIKPGSKNGPPVRASVQEWCRKRDSNPRPPHYE